MILQQRPWMQHARKLPNTWPSFLKGMGWERRACIYDLRTVPNHSAEPQRRCVELFQGRSISGPCWEVDRVEMADEANSYARAKDAVLRPQKVMEWNQYRCTNTDLSSKRTKSTWPQGQWRQTSTGTKNKHIITQPMRCNKSPRYFDNKRNHQHWKHLK